MDSMNSLSLQNHAVGQIQIQSLFLSDNPAVNQRYIFEKITKIFKTSLSFPTLKRTKKHL